MKIIITRGSETTTCAIWLSLIAAIAVFAGSASHLVQASHDASHPFPHATVKVWDTAAPVPPSISLGLTPGESVEDPSGLTRHGTSFPTVTTLYSNGSHPLGPSGLSYWNPDGNLFVWYGKTIGYPPGVDVNRAGPPQPATHSHCGSLSFGPGDVWITGQGEFSELVYVHIAGTDCFRTYGTDPLGPIDLPRDQAWGVEVDDRSGQVFFAAPQSGRIVRLDPPTADFVIWRVGGSPAYVTVDSAGRPYTTLSDSDAILRVDPGADGVLGNADDTATFWRVPSKNGISPSFRKVPNPDLLEEENPNSIIQADAEDNIWFAETNSHEIGRLSPGADGVLGTGDDEICEFTKDELLGPQQIAATGSGDTLQVYFTEFEGDSVSVLSAAEADLADSPARVCTTVPAEQMLFDVFALAGTTVHFDEEVLPLRTAIVPTIHDVPGLDGSASGTTTTADGEPIPPILRFSPMPNPLLSADGTPMGDAGNGYPSGMTGVYAENRVAGAYLKGNKHFEVSSGAIIAPPSLPDDSTIPGRMTGGGSVFTGDGRRVTHGFVLLCEAGKKRHDALQVNWEKGNKFHLEMVLSRACSDDPSIDPDRLEAGFDTLGGTGTGRYNGAGGATIEWTFTDAGEPGSEDTARIVIRDAGGATVLSVSGKLDKGNHQAHQGR